jgi:trk system potassium uptake protein
VGRPEALVRTLRGDRVTAAGEGATTFGRDRRVESVALNMIGVTLLFVAAGMVLSAIVDLVGGADALVPMLGAAALTGTVGLVSWRATRVPRRLAPTRVFGAVTASWLAMVTFGALPYLFDGVFPHWDLALFESISGYTCTGSTVVADIDGLDRGIAFYRQLTQWIGGMGVIVLAVAVLPFLGVGGLELIAAEAPGPTTDRLSPRVSETAKRLWLVYLLLTAAVALALAAAGTGLYDGITHSFTIVATGGFSTFGSGLGEFDSFPVEIVALVGMFLGATSFTLHWRLLHGDWRAYARSSEFRIWVAVLVAATLAVVLINVADGMGGGQAFRFGLFNVVALATTCGLASLPDGGSGDFAMWAPAAQLVLLFLMIPGGMTASTSGAAKWLRVQVLGRVVAREVQLAGSPRAVLPIKHDRKPVAENVVGRIIGFGLLYFVLILAGTMALAALGSTFDGSVGSAVTALGGVGPGLGETGPASNFLTLTRPARGVLSFLMLAGRLELMALLIGVVAPLSWMRGRR